MTTLFEVKKILQKILINNYNNDKRFFLYISDCQEVKEKIDIMSQNINHLLLIVIEEEGKESLMYIAIIKGILNHSEKLWKTY